MKIKREIILCVIIGAVSLLLFAVAGQFYDANNHSILTNTVVWLLLDLFSYCMVVFIPWFEKKKERFIDGWAFSSGLLSIMLYCLSQAKSVDEYSYLSTLSYISGILAIFELFLQSQKSIQKDILQGRVNREYLRLMADEPVDIQKDIAKVIIAFESKSSFKLKDAVRVLEYSERKTRSILKIAIRHSIILEEGNTSAKQYHIRKIDG